MSIQLIPASDTQLIEPVSVDDNGGSLTVDGPLTDTQLRATPVPVSGTVTATTGGLTDTQLRASAVPISDVVIGAVADAAVDTDTTGTVSGKLRGLVKLLVNYLSRFPAALGQTTMAASLPVALASNQSALPVTDNGGSLTVDGTVTAAINGLPTTEFSQVAVTVGQVAVPAANLASRKTISIKALAANGAAVYIGETGVSTTTGYELSAGDSIEIDADATVALFAVSASGTQRVSIAEIA